jgi:hypothetical protein
VLQGRISGATDNSQFLLAGGRISSDGDRPNSDGELGNVIGRFDRKFGDHWTLGAGILVVDNKVGDPGDDRFPTSQGPIGPYSFSNGVARNHSSTTLLTLSAAHEHDDWSGRLTVYRNEGDNDLVNDSAWGTFASSFRMTGFRWSEEAAPWSGGQVRFGLERETIRGEVSGPHVGSPVGTPFGFGTAGTAAIPSFTLSSGQVASVKNVSLNSASPLICLIGRISIPGWSISIIRKVRPFGPFDPSSVRVTTKIQSEIWARLVQIFWPLTTHSPFSSRPLVRTLARSEPAPGSEKP